MKKRTLSALTAALLLAASFTGCDKNEKTPQEISEEEIIFTEYSLENAVDITMELNVSKEDSPYKMTFADIPDFGSKPPKNKSAEELAQYINIDGFAHIKGTYSSEYIANGVEHHEPSDEIQEAAPLWDWKGSLISYCRSDDGLIYAVVSYSYNDSHEGEEDAAIFECDPETGEATELYSFASNEGHCGQICCFEGKIYSILQEYDYNEGSDTTTHHTHFKTLDLETKEVSELNNSIAEELNSYYQIFLIRDDELYLLLAHETELYRQQYGTLNSYTVMLLNKETGEFEPYDDEGKVYEGYSMCGKPAFMYTDEETKNAVITLPKYYSLDTGFRSNSVRLISADENLIEWLVDSNYGAYTRTDYHSYNIETNEHCCMELRGIGRINMISCAADGAYFIENSAFSNDGSDQLCCLIPRLATAYPVPDTERISTMYDGSYIQYSLSEINFNFINSRFCWCDQ